MAVIPPRAVDFYRQHGYYLHRQPLFSEEQFQKLSAIFEEHLAGKGEKRADQLDVPHFRDPRLFEFLLADEVLDLVEPFLGPDVALWSSHFICKEPEIGRATPWHEDSSYAAHTHLVRTRCNSVTNRRWRSTGGGSSRSPGWCLR